MRAKGGRGLRGGGFSLIEVLIAIFLLGTLAFVLIPNLQGTKDRTHEGKLKACARALMVAQESFFAENGVYASSHNLLEQDTLEPCEEVTLNGSASGSTYAFNLSFRGLTLTVTQDGIQ